MFFNVSLTVTFLQKLYGFCEFTKIPEFEVILFVMSRTSRVNRFCIENFNATENEY